MPWHMTFICPKCGARLVSPEIHLTEQTLKLIAGAIAGAEIDPTFACYRCNPTAVDSEPDMVESRELAIYVGPPPVVG